MTYDHWKATEPDDGVERPVEQDTELRALYEDLAWARFDIARLERENADLLTAAKELLRVREWGHPAWAHFAEAIAKAEESAL
jgi:hypothetical protein